MNIHTLLTALKVSLSLFSNLVSCCLAINIVVHWALKALLTMLLPEQLFERLCNIIWCCCHKKQIIFVFLPPSLDPLVLILDLLYLRWCIVSMMTQPTQTSRCTGVVHWLQVRRGGCIDSHYHKLGEPWEKSEGVWCVWICYVIEGVVGYGIKVCWCYVD